MSWIIRRIVAGGAAAFFFFSWILQLLWNSLIAGHIAPAAPTLSYFQAAGLWFFVSLMFAWTGIGARPRSLIRWDRRTWAEWGVQTERKVKRCVSDWLHNLGPDAEAHLEHRIKRGFARWAEVDDDLDWDDLGEHIERKIKRHLREWMDDA